MALVGHWSLAEEDYTGGVFTDLSGNGNNGTPANAPVFTTNQQARANAATVFNGTSDKVTVTHNAAFNLATMTFSCWVKRANNNLENHWVISKGHYATSYSTLLSAVGSLPISQQYIGTTYLNSTSRDWTVWNHFISTFDGTNIRIYINGVLDAGPKAATVLTNSNNIGIGHYNSYYTLGAICNVRIYNYALTPAEIANIYASELFWNPQTFTGAMDFTGSLSAQNPKWLMIDNTLNWMGEWDTSYPYAAYDAVLYKTPDSGEWHIFVSKVLHNTGNTPTTSPAYWRRYYQEQLI